LPTTVLKASTFVYFLPKWEKFCTKVRPADCLPTQILWASKQLVVVIKTVACIRRWLVFKGGLYSREACIRGRLVFEGDDIMFMYAINF